MGGDYQEVKTSEAVVAFTRGLPEQTCFVALNYSAETQTVEVTGKAKRVVYSSAGRGSAEGGRRTHRPEPRVREDRCFLFRRTVEACIDER